MITLNRYAVSKSYTLNRYAVSKSYTIKLDDYDHL